MAHLGYCVFCRGQDRIIEEPAPRRVIEVGISSAVSRWRER